MDASAASLSPLARPSGGLAMVAIDQRESLRGMFADAGHGAVDDETLVRFKTAVAEILAPLASAMLFDRLYALPAFDVAGRVAPGCGRIMAADALHQVTGQPVDDTDIDEAVSPEAMRGRGAVALKLLLLWRPDDTRERNIGIARRFMDMCRRAGLIGIVETVARPTAEATREFLIVDAARALAPAKPDLYKCEVPFQGRESHAAMADIYAAVHAASLCPWVVLSQGVPVEKFAGAVEVACRNGASGFLAGRAIWADTIRSDDYVAAIKRDSAARLRDLAAIVDGSIGARR